MNTRKLATFGIVAALLAGTTLATASSDTGAAKRAASSAHRAEKAIAKHRADTAIDAAEVAVALMPQDAGYRALLGQAYLTAGRFTSAADALNDALALDPTNGDAALHLALAQIANGDWARARETLNQHEETIAPADRGLGLALAGDPDTAVSVLTAAARAPGADAKTRQNLALSLALAGRWVEAKTDAAADVAPAELDQRIMQWAAFAKPTSASDQVAALLGVTPIEDGGQPERLALNTTRPTMAAVAQAVSTVDAYMPGQGAGIATAASASVAPSAAESAAVAPAAPPPGTPNIVFAERREIVQPLPASAPVAMARAMTVRPAAPAKLALAPRPAAAPAPAPERQAPRLARGNYYVQLGAYENAGVAHDAWSRLSRAHAPLGMLSPQGIRATVHGASYYRLSVGGFARGVATRLCGSLRARGARCFIRTDAGDVAAVWGRQQVAAR